MDKKSTEQVAGNQVMSNPLRSAVTPVARLLDQLGLEATPKARPASGSHDRYSPIDISPDEERPFLSVLTRTQGRRPSMLREVLLCLSAQTCQDFELLIVAHKPDAEVLRVIEDLVNEAPLDLRVKIRLLTCDYGNRTAPLNMGFAAAKGHYVSILDDDDIIFANWVEEFKNCALRSPGRIVRVVCASQEVDRASWDGGSAGFRAVSPIRKAFPSEHDFFAHLVQNFSPTLALAFPSYVFREMGVRFDESLNTAEDWDFETRNVFICGVESSPEITCVYRKWRSGESSATVHSVEEWKADYQRIVEKNDSQYHIFPPGTMRLMQTHQQLIKKLERDVAELRDALNSTSALRRWLQRYPRIYGLLARGWRLGKKIKARLQNRS